MKTTKKLKKEIEEGSLDGISNVDCLESQLKGRQEGIQLAEELIDEIQEMKDIEEGDEPISRKELKQKLKAAREE